MKTRAAMVTLLGLRGTPFLYYGDELGMPETAVPEDRILDPVGKLHGARLGRDPERTPMQWTAEPGAGFTRPRAEPWLPFGDPSTCNVADQRRDADSMLSLTRDLIGLRNAIPELRNGTYRTLPSTNNTLWAWSRGERAVVAVTRDVSLVPAGPSIRVTARARAVAAAEPLYPDGLPDSVGTSMSAPSE